MSCCAALVQPRVASLFSSAFGVLTGGLSEQLHRLHGVGVLLADGGAEGAVGLHQAKNVHSRRGVPHRRHAWRAVISFETNPRFIVPQKAQ